MTDAAAISGDFATYRHVQGRKVLQLVIEVPAELAATVFATLGTPGAGEGIPVALARLHSPAEPIAKPEAPKERRLFSELPYSTQAAMRCQDNEFRAFLVSREPAPFHMDESGAIETVRSYCGVKSRSEIVIDTPAGDRWETLEAEFYAWSRGMR